MNTVIKKYICKYCGNEFEKSTQLGSHVIRCEKNPRYYEIRQTLLNKASQRAKIKHPKIKFELVCPVCNKHYFINVTQHIYDTGKYKHTCSSECAHKLSSFNTNREETNNKISKSLEGKERQLKTYICEYCGNEHSIKEYRSYRYCSKDCASKGKRKKLSELAKKHNFGGYVEESVNKCKQGWYHGIHCDSSWELAFILWNEYHGNDIKRYSSYFTYEYNGKIFKYYPDFIVNDKDIYEIKGYYSDRAKAKHEQNPEVILLLRKDILPILEEVETIYGKDFTRLYNK